MTILKNPQDWDRFCTAFDQTHLLQSASWGLFKSYYGWEPGYVSQAECGAQILFRKMPLGYTIAYIPKGPVGQNWQSLWQEVDALCRQKKAIMLIVEPNLWEPLPAEVTSNWLEGFVSDPHTIQPRRTLLVDLRPSKEIILAAMKQKTRYNINLAQRKGVVVQETDDLKTFYDMMQITGERDQFALHEFSYYEKVYAQFAPAGQCALLQASFEGTPLAALMVFAHQDQAWYFYGASSEKERNRMPTYLLQWEAMRWAKTKSCTTYDLWGVPDEDEDALESQFTTRSDGLWGVYRFKRGFGGQLKRSAPAFVRVYRSLLYRAYQLAQSRKPEQG